MEWEEHAIREYVAPTGALFEPKKRERRLTTTSEDDFRDLIEHDSEVSTLTAKDFDPQGEYKNVIEAVEQSGDGKARIYRVEHDRTRVEYYIVGFDKEGGKVVGLKAKAVES